MPLNIKFINVGRTIKNSWETVIDSLTYLNMTKALRQGAGIIVLPGELLEFSYDYKEDIGSISINDKEIGRWRMSQVNPEKCQ